jgi:NADP-dependent 3-hydroxy acid dehydrogenase YdfG
VDLGLRDRVVLISGAGGGAGPTLARTIADESARVALRSFSRAVA